MKLKAGQRLKSAVCTTEIIIVRPPAADVDLRCAGHPVVATDAERTSDVVDPAFAAGSPIGKRYAEAGLGLEVLVVKAGPGSLSIGNVPLELKDAKPLPSSD